MLLKQFNQIWINLLLSLEIIQYASGDIMDFEIKRLKEDVRDQYKNIGDLFHETYTKDYLVHGGLNWEEKYAEWYFNSYHYPPDFFFSAWKGDELIATTVGTQYKIMLDNEIELTGVSIGLTATHPKYQRQGIQKALLAKLIEAAKNEGVDFLWAFAQNGHYGSKLSKTHFNFQRINKNAEHLIKILHDHGRWVLQHYRGLGAVLAKLAMIYAVIPEDELMGGEIREGNENSDDIKKVVDIMNSYTKRLPLSRMWTVDKFKYDVTQSRKISDYYPEWRYFWLVWEKDGDILASITIRTEIVNFEKGKSTVGLVTNSMFKDTVPEEEKTGFFASIIRRFHEEEYPEEVMREKKLFTLQTTQPQYEPKLFKNTKCNDDTSKYEFVILPLTENAEQIPLRYKKVKTFYIPYHR